MLNERTMNIFEENDITVHDREQQNGEFYREIEFYSNAGEDVIEIVWYDGTDEGFIKAFRQLADDFDVNDHAAMYIGDRGNHGIPDSVRELIDDAEEIKETLLTVADELETDVDDEENSSTMSRQQFIDYIEENFNISGETGRLINNILCFVENNYCDEDEQYNVLCELLDNTIGLSDAEIRKVCL